MKCSDLVSQQIRDFKDGNPDAFCHFLGYMSAAVLELRLPDSVIVCAVPSCSGVLKPLQRLAADIAEICGLIDGIELIKKRFQTESFCKSGRRSYADLYDSILVDDLINGRHILLLDDVSTTGTSFAAVSARLFEAGAASVTCLAIAKTVLVRELEPAAI
jgi:glutamine phosphoribosylpyrophosphate amidotransferase